MQQVQRDTLPPVSEDQKGACHHTVVFPAESWAIHLLLTIFGRPYYQSHLWHTVRL